ncbi:MAG: DUF89 family protein [Actinomycetales bacterium]|jgi:Uncharacterized conserved protein|nr:DUF89 family protein [Actinomycetales bacterium]
MELFLDCLPCLLRQVLEAARMASDDEAVQARIMDDAVATLARHGEFATAPAMAAEMHGLVRRHTGLDDPYAAIKARDVAAALGLVPLLEEFVGVAVDPLAAAVKVSATGNVMDSALFKDLDITAVVRAELERPFAAADLAELRTALAGARTVLVIGDNAGEAVFDTLLLRELAREHEVVFAVRSRPIINDVTADEARAIGVDRYARVVASGCGAPGLILAEADPVFRELFDAVDVVISKGQGNFEALSDAPRDVFFLLKAKCAKIGHALDVPVGAYVLRLHAPTGVVMR